MAFFPQDDTQDVSGLPANDVMAQLELQRRLKMAQQLQEAKNPEGQMVSGHYVAPSWTQYAANAMNKYFGRKAEEEAVKGYGAYQKSKASQLGDVLESLKTTTKDVPLDTVQTGGMPGMWETQTVQPDINKTIELMNKYDPNFGAKIAETRISKYLTPESNLGKVEIDKFTPQSIAAYQKTGDYSSLVPVTKTSTKYTNIQTDAAGVPFGFNTETQRFEKLPGETTAKTQWSEPKLVGNEYVQKNPITGEVRKAYEAPEKQAFTKTTELRNDFNNLPQVKSWNVIEPVLMSAREAAKDTSGASDLNMIYALGKVLDPNSVVREGELDMAANTGSLGQKIAGYYKSVNQGGKLPPSVKQDLLRQIESRTYSQKQQYESAKNKYTEIAKKNQLDPNDLFISTVVEPVDISKTPSNINVPQQNATHRFNPATGKIEVIKQ